MDCEFKFRLPLPNGLHARPASHLAEVARSYQAAVTFRNERSGRTANAKSVLALVGTDSRENDPCCLLIAGIDADIAHTELAAFIETQLGRCDEPLAVDASAPGRPRIPRALHEAGLAQFQAGTIACRGLGWAKLVIARVFQPPAELRVEKQIDPAQELTRFAGAIAQVRADYARSVNAARGTAASVLQAHLSLLGDPTLADRITERIREGQSAGEAVRRTIGDYADMLGNAESSYLRERVLDLEDIGTHLLERIYGTEFSAPLPVLDMPCILVAERLTPRQFLSLDRTKLQGLALGHAGLTSHTVILARSFNIPTLTGIGHWPAAQPRKEAIIDANLGILITDLSPGVRAYYERERAKLGRIQEQLVRLRDRAGATRDGRRLEVGANIATGDEAAMAFSQGAEGIGLFRTEMLFAGRASAPDEEEQYAIYASVIRAAAGRPVVIRTLDIGGDKSVSFLRLPTENNPFLGYRGVRLYADHRPLIRGQMRALWRAARHGPLKVLVPMVSCLEEAELARQIFEEARASLGEEGRDPGTDVSFGLMLEVPAVAFLIDELCRISDFFSLGTNDLIQYFVAADRENENVAPLHTPWHPAFLRLLRYMVGRVRANGRWIGLCGQMAEDPAILPILVGLELDEISVSAPRIAAIKSELAKLDLTDCTVRLSRALACATRDGVRRELEAGRRRTIPMISEELLLDDLECGSKAEVIHAMVDALHLAGRTDRPAVVEEAIWRREDSYSTGFGDGFALPHCKSDDVVASSIVIARLKRPVVWQSLDGRATDLVLLLVMRSSDYEREHMRSLAQLSRLMMQERFRAEVRTSRTAAELVNLIATNLAVPADKSAATPATPTPTPIR